MTTAAVIRPVTSEEDLLALAAVTALATPDDPTSLEEMSWSDATYPGSGRFLAELDGRAVVAATVGRIYVYPPEHPELWATIVVAPEARRQGIGGALLAAVSAHAQRAGKVGLQLRTSEGRPEGIAFLSGRGFSELERARMVRLELADLAAPTVAMPAGTRLTDLATDPALVPGVHAVALETFADIPGGEDTMAVGDLAEFRARDVDRPGIPLDAFKVALDVETGEVVGYANLVMLPGSETVAWHDMTAVLRAWRGRGLATALKRATIGWAIEHGLTALETGNDEANASMRAINIRLGYAALPDEITMRGPLDLTSHAAAPG
ncbi:MAG: GNAT family N-acetyltransferase [Candidatus Limnocylindrales bacterium]